MNYQAIFRRYAPPPILKLYSRVESSAGGVRMARGMFWSIIGAVGSRALALAASIISAHILGKKVFGELGILQSTNNMFATFATVGVGLTAAKHVAEFRVKDPERAGRIIALSSVVAWCSGSFVGLIMIVGASRLATLLAAPHLSLAIALSSVALLCTVVNEAQNGALSGLEAFKRRSGIHVIAGIASFPVSVAGVYFFGLIGAVFALIVSQGVIAILGYRGVMKEARAAGVPINWRDIRKEAGVLIGFSLPTLLSGSVYIPSIWVLNAVIANTPHGFEEMGIFRAADGWRTAIMFLPMLLGGVTLPMLSGLHGTASSKEYQTVLWTNIKLSTLVSFIAAAPIALLSRWIMRSYGPGFEEGKWILVALCVVSVAHAAYWIVSQALASHGHVWTMFSINLCWATVFLGTGWLFRMQGAKALAAAYLLADGMRLGLALLYVRSTSARA